MGIIALIVVASLVYLAIASMVYYTAEDCYVDKEIALPVAIAWLPLLVVFLTILPLIIVIAMIWSIWRLVKLILDCIARDSFEEDD